MKRIIFTAISMVVTLLIGCNNPSVPEQHGQDERLFGRSVIRPRLAMWEKMGGDGGRVDFMTADKIKWRIAFVEHSGAYLTFDWYTKDAILYTSNFEHYIGGNSDTYIPYRYSITFNYEINGDTLTLSNGAGELARCNGKYLYRDIDAKCAASGYMGECYFEDYK